MSGAIWPSLAYLECDQWTVAYLPLGFPPQGAVTYIDGAHVPAYELSSKKLAPFLLQHFSTPSSLLFLQSIKWLFIIFLQFSYPCLASVPPASVNFLPFAPREKQWSLRQQTGTRKYGCFYPKPFSTAPDYFLSPLRLEPAVNQEIGSCLKCLGKYSKPEVLTKLHNLFMLFTWNKKKPPNPFPLLYGLRSFLSRSCFQLSIVLP